MRRNARRLKAFNERKQTTQVYREVSESGKCDSGNTNQDSSAKADGSTPGPGTVSYHRPSHAHPPKLKLPSLSLDFQKSVQASIESEPTKLGTATSQPEKLLQETPPSHHPFLQILRNSLQPSLRQMQLKPQMFRL